MLKQLKSFETLIIFGLYFVPMLLWSLMSFSHMEAATHWTLYSFGLLLSLGGSLAIWLLTDKKEVMTPPPSIIAAPPPPQIMIKAEIDPNPALQEEIERLEQQIENLKVESRLDLEKTRARLIAEHETEKNEREKHLQRAQERIQELEAKIGELEYEIKTLVDYNPETISEEGWLSSENEASRILHKWLDASSNIAAPQLAQLIQGEGRALVFIYGLHEGKALYANGHSLTLFGLTPEQFAEKFHTFIPKESLAWHEALHKTSQDKWAEIRLKDTKGVLAPISTGPLKNHLLGIIY